MILILLHFSSYFQWSTRQAKLKTLKKDQMRHAGRRGTGENHVFAHPSIHLTQRTH